MSSRTFVQAGAQNALEDPGEIARFYDCCSDLMRELLDALSEHPDQPRAFPVIEDAMGWPRRRISSVLGGVARMRYREFAGRRPYRFQSERQSKSGRWEMWVDADQAHAIRSARQDEESEVSERSSSSSAAAAASKRSSPMRSA